MADPRLPMATKRIVSLEDFVADVLAYLEEERRHEGVDEWDEADARALLYCDAWSILGEERAAQAIKERVPS